MSTRSRQKMTRVIAECSPNLPFKTLQFPAAYFIQMVNVNQSLFAVCVVLRRVEDRCKVQKSTRIKMEEYHYSIKYVTNNKSNVFNSRRPLVTVSQACKIINFATGVSISKLTPPP